ncbi:TPA: hypothetical protein ACGGNX_004582, partial [Escherichia coli]
PPTSGEHSFQQDKVEIPNKELTDFHSFQVSLFLEFVNHIFSHFSIFVNQTNAKTRRSGLSAGALRMPGTSEVAGDYSPAGSLTPQVRKL